MPVNPGNKPTNAFEEARPAMSDRNDERGGDAQPMKAMSVVAVDGSRDRLWAVGKNVFE